MDIISVDLPKRSRRQKKELIPFSGIAFSLYNEDDLAGLGYLLAVTSKTPTWSGETILAIGYKTKKGFDPVFAPKWAGKENSLTITHDDLYQNCGDLENYLRTRLIKSEYPRSATTLFIRKLQVVMLWGKGSREFIHKLPRQIDTDIDEGVGFTEDEDDSETYLRVLKEAVMRLIDMSFPRENQIH